MADSGKTEPVVEYRVGVLEKEMIKCQERHEESMTKMDERMRKVENALISAASAGLSRKQLLSLLVGFMALIGTLGAAIIGTLK